MPWLGKAITIVEKTDNVEIMGNIVTGSIDANAGVY